MLIGACTEKIYYSSLSAIRIIWGRGGQDSPGIRTIKEIFSGSGKIQNTHHSMLK
jgi:hypothetical protein